MENELLSKTLAQIVSANHEAARVFEKYDLDFCCGGKRSLQKACEEKNLAVQTIAKEVNIIFNKNESPPIDFNKLTLSALT